LLSKGISTHQVVFVCIAESEFIEDVLKVFKLDFVAIELGRFPWCKKDKGRFSACPFSDLRTAFSVSNFGKTSSKMNLESGGEVCQRN